MTPSIGASTSRAWAEVDLDAIDRNVEAIARAAGEQRSVMAVVKADAYGHGLTAVGRRAHEAGAAWLGVATVEEGAELRDAGVEAPIALLCAAAPEQAAELVRCRLTPLVGDGAYAEALAREAGGRPLAVHLDIETGMGRAGVLLDHAAGLWRQCVELGLLPDGLCTHFADADGEAPGVTDTQWQLFCEARRRLEEAGARFAWVHASNSPAIIRFRGHGCNMVRPGLLVYGIAPPIGSPQERRELVARLRPALSLKARIGTVRDLPRGHTISYGCTHRLGRDSRVATVLIGYGDGYPRRLSNNGHVLVRGRRAPILGRICMDQTVVDVTGIAGAAPGDIVTCIGTDGDLSLSASDLAGRIDTIEHEVLTGLSARLPRVYVGQHAPS